jgi:hypothetical protein
MAFSLLNVDKIQKLKIPEMYNATVFSAQLIPCFNVAIVGVAVV